MTPWFALPVRCLVVLLKVPRGLVFPASIRIRVLTTVPSVPVQLLAKPSLGALLLSRPTNILPMPLPPKNLLGAPRLLPTNGRQLGNRFRDLHTVPRFLAALSVHPTNL